MFQALAFSPLLGLMKLPLNRRKQALQIVLHDIILRALFQHGYGGLFTDSSREDDAGCLRTLGTQESERISPCEVRHGVVADNHIPLVLTESCGHASRCVDPFKCGLVAATAQLPNHQRHVIFRIFDNQYAQGSTHSVSFWQGCRLVQNQPVETELSDSIDELAEIDGLADVAVSA